MSPAVAPWASTPEDLRAAVERWCEAKRFLSDPASVCDGPEYREVSAILCPGCSLAVVREALDLCETHRWELVVPLREALGDGPDLRPWELGVPSLVVRAYRTWVETFGLRGAR